MVCQNYYTISCAELRITFDQLHFLFLIIHNGYANGLSFCCGVIAVNGGVILFKSFALPVLTILKKIKKNDF